METLIAEHVSRLGLDDAYSSELLKLLADIDDPVQALRQARWTIPPHEQLRAMEPRERVVVLVPVVAVVIGKLAGKLHLSNSTQRELVSEGLATLASLDFTHARNIKAYAWKAVYRSTSSALEDLMQPQVAWSRGDGAGGYARGVKPLVTALAYQELVNNPDDFETNSETANQPLNGQYLDAAIPREDRPGIYSRKPLEPPFDWSGVLPALRSLYDCCQGDIDRAIVACRWADGDCVTQGVLVGEEVIAKQLGIEVADVKERLACLRNRWRHYINRTQRFPKHLPAL